MRPVYGRSPWIDRAARSRVPAHPKARGDYAVDVAIVGGGLVGCATAYAFAAAGVTTALFEAERVGQGSSGASSGWITDEPASGFVELDAALGRRAARQVWQGWHRASLDFAGLVRRLGIRCHDEARPSLLVARSAAQALVLAREQKLRAAAGLDFAGLAARSLESTVGFPAVAALCSPHGTLVDPFLLTHGLAAAAAKHGAALFERSPVTKTASSKDGCIVTLDAALVRARHVVIATGAVPSWTRPLARHVRRRRTFIVQTEPIPAPLRKSLGTRDHLLRDLAKPAHRIWWSADHRLLVSGADADDVPARLRDAMVVQRTGQLMYELSTFYPAISGLQPEYGWDAAYSATRLGLPIAGPHRNYPNHTFAFGGASPSLTGAWLASRVLLRHYTGEVLPDDLHLGFTR